MFVLNQNVFGNPNFSLFYLFVFNQFNFIKFCFSIIFSFFVKNKQSTNKTQSLDSDSDYDYEDQIPSVSNLFLKKNH